MLQGVQFAVLNNYFLESNNQLLNSFLQVLALIFWRGQTLILRSNILNNCKIYIHYENQCVAPCICTGTIKNNYNFMVQIIHFFEKMFKLYTVLAYSFFKPYISKTCNGFSFRYMIQNLICFGFFLFLHLIIHLPQKLKTQMDMWQKIGLQLKSNLESNQIQTF